MKRWLWMAPLLVLLAAAPAQATPLTWTLENVTLADGGTASGWFVYDADSDLVSEWAISVAGGDLVTFPAFTWSSADPLTAYDSALVAEPIPGLWLINFSAGSFPDYAGAARQIRMTFDVELPDTHDTLVPLWLGNRWDADCYACNPYRLLATGQVRSQLEQTAVPEPATLLLLGAGLVGLATARKRRG